MPATTVQLTAGTNNKIGDNRPKNETSLTVF